MADVTDEKNQDRLSTAEAAHLAGVNVSYIRRLAADGTIKASKLGGRYWVIERRELERWLAGREDG